MRLTARIQTLLLLFVLVLLGVLVYGRAIDSGFLGADGLTLIETAQITSPEDLTAILTEPMMADTQFTARFYRPLSTLTYSLDHALWGMNFSGYIVTNLVLHVVGAIVGFFLVRQLLPQEMAVAALTALLFVVHFTGLENVVEPAGRQDILPVTLSLLSLLLFTSGVRQRRWWLQAAAIIVYVLAFAAKEIAIVVPGLVVIYMVMLDTAESKSLRQRVLRVAAAVLPYIAVTLILLAWRTYVLQGLGGYSETFSLLGNLQLWFRTFTQYFVFLFLPVEPLRAFFSPFPSDLVKLVSGVVLALVVIGLIARRGALTGMITRQQTLLAKVATAGVLLLGIACTVGLLLYPFLAQSINQWTETAYLNGSSIFTRSADDSSAVASSYLFFRIRDLLVMTLLFGLMLSVLVLAALQNGVRRTVQWLFTARTGKLVVLMAAWLAAPLALYLATRVFASRTWYVSAFPASLCIALVVVWLYRLALARSIIPAEAARLSSQRGALTPALWMAIVAALIVIPVGAALMRDYTLWNAGSELSDQFFERLNVVADDLADEAVVEIEDVPQLDELIFLSDYGIKTWMDIHYPHNRVQIRVVNYMTIPPCDSITDLDVEAVNEDTQLVRVQYASPTGAACE